MKIMPIVLTTILILLVTNQPAVAQQATTTQFGNGTITNYPSGTTETTMPFGNAALTHHFG